MAPRLLQTCCPAGSSLRRPSLKSLTLQSLTEAHKRQPISFARNLTVPPPIDLVRIKVGPRTRRAGHLVDYHIDVSQHLAHRPGAGVEVAQVGATNDHGTG